MKRSQQKHKSKRAIKNVFEKQAQQINLSLITG